MGVILVTGASRGIGRGIARELARAGHRLAIHYNGNRKAALAAAQECAQLYREAGPAAAGASEPGARGATEAGAALQSAEPTAVFQANIAIPEDRERLVSEVYERFGVLDGLVNNAGIAPRKRDDIVYSEEAVFDEVLRVNLYGPYFLTQLVARRWIEGGKASVPTELEPRRIVFVTSVSSEMVSTSRGEYCVSKAGLSMAVQLFSVRLAAEGILVHEVRPGIVETDMTSGVKEKYDRLIAEGLVPQKRWGYPADTGKVVSSIMNGSMDFSPGSVIHTDGGLHIARL
jgi:NAD(P)-dependent dehydrogenase (short-subunit alcohol dehydrogenase family)